MPYYSICWRFQIRVRFEPELISCLTNSCFGPSILESRYQVLAY